MAIEAREKMKLRHVPLLIVREMARHAEHKKLVCNALDSVIQRVDELAEFLAIYWKDGKQPLSAQVKLGLATAFAKFSEYQLAKYDRDNDIKLRDVMFLCHARPTPGVAGYDRKARKNGAPAPTDKGSMLFRKLVDGELATPDTWEVNLSAGKDKNETFTRLINSGKLGAMALVRNLRNMAESGVSEELIDHALDTMKVEKVLPFRFITAARAVPQWESKLDTPMLKCLAVNEKLSGTTVLIVDISGSMDESLSKKSTVSRKDTACALALLIREIAEKPRIFATAGDDGRRIHATKEVPDRHGFALVDAIKGMNSTLGGGGIFLKQVIDYTRSKVIGEVDRVIVITDEQDCSGDRSTLSVAPYGKNNYLINVASAANGIGYGMWTHLDGFSEAVIDYILEYEKLSN
jgi:hypothetical protein